jgi:hypothetical protein
VGKRSVVVLGLVALAALRCDNDYPIAPTPCDDYCLATQRAGCEEDWPDNCVGFCELNRSPTSYPHCSEGFDALLACYQVLGDDDFECVNDGSEPLPGLCEDEKRTHDFCLAPLLYRCLEYCGTRAERCDEIDANACVRGCLAFPSECEDAAVRFLDCELAEESACYVTCYELYVELYNCFNGVIVPPE